MCVPAAAALDRIGGRFRAPSTSPGGPGVGPPLGSVVMFMPGLAQKDFFGPREFAIAVGDVFKWEGGAWLGVTPLPCPFSDRRRSTGLGSRSVGERGRTLLRRLSRR